MQTGPSGEQERLRVAELGEIDAPSHVDEVGLGLTTSQRLLGDLQQAFVAIQEAALRAKAAQMRAGYPTLRLKDYHGELGEHAGQPPHEQVPADALVRPRRPGRPRHPHR